MYPKRYRSGKSHRELMKSEVRPCRVSQASPELLAELTKKLGNTPPANPVYTMRGRTARVRNLLKRKSL